MKIAIAFIALQLIFGYFTIQIERSLISLEVNALSLLYWITLITSSILYFSLTFMNPGFVIQQPEVAEQKVFNNTGQTIKKKEEQQPQSQSQPEIDIQISQQVDHKEDMIPTKSESVSVTQQQNITTSITTLRSLKSTSPMLQQEQPKLLFELQKRYCRHCHLDQPHRTKHCYDCEKCVATYDHHCPWVNNCIGQNNRAVFYLFTISQNLQISVTMYITLKHLPSNLIECAILFSFQLILLVMMTTLMGFHSFLMAVGCTTWEYLKWSSINYLQGYDRPFGPFYEGICKNIKVFWSFLFKLRKSNYEWKVINNGKRKQIKS